MDIINRKRENLADKGLWERIGVLLLLIVICIVHYKMKIEDVPVYHDVLSSAFDGKIIFPFEQITGFEIMVHDEDVEGFLDAHELTLHVWIENEEEEAVWNNEYKNAKLRSLFFEKITENMEQPVSVEKNHSYYIHCSAEEVELSNVTFRVYGDKAGFGGIYFSFVFCALIVLAIPLFAGRIIRKIKLEYLGLSIMLGVGILYYIVMPPICGPDELFHFAQAYAVSDTFLGTENEDPNVIMVPEDLNNIRYVQIRQTMFSFYDHLFDREYNNTPVEFQYRQISRDGYPPYTYLLPGLGIALGRLAGLNPQWILILGRLGNLLFASFILSLGIRLMPFGKLSYLLFSIIPMTSALVGTYTYDCFSLVLVSLFFALCMKYAYDEKCMNWKRVMLLTGLAVLVMPVKAIYIPMIIFVFFIPAKKYATNKKWLGGTAIIVLGSVLALLWKRLGYLIQEQLAYTVPVSGEAATGFGNMMAEAGAASIVEPARYTVSRVLTNIEATIKIYLNTIYEYADSYFWTALGIRHTDIFIPTIIIAAVAVIYLVVCATERDVPEINWWQRCLVVLSGAGILFLIMTVMFLLWIDFGDNVIEGVNGRYLLPWLVCLPLLVKNKTFSIKKDITVQALTGMVFLNIVIMLLIFGDLLRW